MAQVGDKFVIEIGEITKGAESGQTKYRIKGFDGLFFDEKGLKKLSSYEDYYNSAWNEGYRACLSNQTDLNGYMKGYHDATLKGVKVITEMAEKYSSSLGETEE